ncbi:choline transporter [Neisseria sicca]|uniref:Choline transporter n=1 Tax=Neisseria sicca TaxID=490 RepID=A0A2I1XFA5_NEISI|nr:choline transporter [Neisseria sicca]PLA41297.1 choline transporter [Neisseria sicca]
MSFIFFGIAAHSRCVLPARKSRADYTLGTRTNKGRLKFGFHDENLFRRPFSVEGIKQTNVLKRGRFWL